MSLISKSIFFELVTESDAGFILSLRNDNKYNQHLSQTSNDFEDQVEWLRKYKEREINNDEFYFIIKRKFDGEKIGTVRLYDFTDNPHSFCWGSWILNNDKTLSSAIESALLVYSFAFRELGFLQSHFDVRNENVKVIGFHKKMGAIEISKDNENTFFIYKKETFEANFESYNRFMR
ncbi:GNAT family N-acetyltransferase [Pantoea sp. GM01]|uniref:GNAT family N-acetyltransferase n=1 Tax=Pantoea sp. GM01 TaxID=1144320 RepID=UPI000271435F|nr:GNAT family N-acetyltransferase [Pantoea sp. GM01]EJL89603.1 hypothetical protein PMI17_02087 [Pantoea sp. GM01]